MKNFLLLLFIFSIQFAFGQNAEFQFNDKTISYTGEKELSYDVTLKKDVTYQIVVYQENIDVEVILADSNNNKITSVDLADGNKGYDKLEYSPEKDASFKLIIKSVSPKIVSNGLIKINLRALSKKEISKRKKIQQELQEENSKSISTVDIQHFWEMYDKLKDAKSYRDSVNIVQENYLDRATNGLKEFEKVRYSAAEFYVERIKTYKKYYESVRKNTLLFSKSDQLSYILKEIKKIYPEATPAKTALIVSPMSTPGTISNNYLLLGIEMLAGDKTNDLSEIKNENLKSDILSRENQNDVLAYVHETLAHEYIHTQQKKVDKNACQCILLEHIIKEGVASFIAEKLIMKKNTDAKSRSAKYVDENEKELWTELKSQLCTKDLSNWLFNAAQSKNRPGDLGYRMGYKIAEAYYENAQNKNEAIKEMIEMDNPLIFLDKSKYDLKFR